MRAETFKTVSVLDPALDTGSMTIVELDKFQESRDYAIVEHRVVLGMKPVVYSIREIHHVLMNTYVLATNDVHEQRRRAFQCGVFRVENLIQNDGVAITFEPATRHPRLDVVYMSDEECNTRFAPSEREEIGSVVFSHSFLPRRIENCFQLPSLLLEPLGQRRVLRADANPSSALAASNEKPSESLDQMPPATATDSAPAAAA